MEFTHCCLRFHQLDKIVNALELNALPFCMLFIRMDHAFIQRPLLVPGQRFCYYGGVWYELTTNFVVLGKPAINCRTKDRTTRWSRPHSATSAPTCRQSSVWCRSRACRSRYYIWVWKSCVDGLA